MQDFYSSGHSSTPLSTIALQCPNARHLAPRFRERASEAGQSPYISAVTLLSVRYIALYVTREISLKNNGYDIDILDSYRTGAIGSVYHDSSPCQSGLLPPNDLLTFRKIIPTVVIFPYTNHSPNDAHDTPCDTRTPDAFLEHPSSRPNNKYSRVLLR